MYIIPKRIVEFKEGYEAILRFLTSAVILFPFGEVYLTIGAREALAESVESANQFLAKHQSGDWGCICEDDKKENDFSVENGFRILSAYKTASDVKLWVITEADRSSTTVLLPSEY